MRNPRIFVTLDREMAAAIRGIARHTGQSASSIIAAFVEPRRAVLFQLHDALERLNGLPQPLSPSLRAKLYDLGDEVAGLEEQALTALDQLTLDIQTEQGDNSWAEARARTDLQTEGRARVSSKTPPVFNKGVTNGGEGS